MRQTRFENNISNISSIYSDINIRYQVNELIIFKNVNHVNFCQIDFFYIFYIIIYFIYFFTNFG